LRRLRFCQLATIQTQCFHHFRHRVGSQVWHAVRLLRGLISSKCN
jgi:hypothetical protein